jgi:hypothetical protein
MWYSQASSLSCWQSIAPQHMVSRAHAEQPSLPACTRATSAAGGSGFLLPLSGGADSASTAAIVGCMCQLVVKAVAAGDTMVLADALRIGQYKEGEQVRRLVVVWCGVVWCGVVWCGVVWCGVVWCGVVWCGVVWCGVVWCGVVWWEMVWWEMVWWWCGVCGGGGHLASASSCPMLADAAPQVADAQELANRIFVTVYMGTVNSGEETRGRAKRLAAQIGAYHMDVKIDTVVSAMTTLFTTITGELRLRLRLLQGWRIFDSRCFQQAAERRAFRGVACVCESCGYMIGTFSLQVIK